MVKHLVSQFIATALLFVSPLAGAQAGSGLSGTLNPYNGILGADLDGMVILAHHDWVERTNPYTTRGAITPLPIDCPEAYGIRVRFLPRSVREAGYWSPEGNLRAVRSYAERGLDIILLDGLDLSEPRFIGSRLNPPFLDLMTARYGSQERALWAIRNQPSLYMQEVLSIVVRGYRPLLDHGIKELPENAIVMVRDHSKPPVSNMIEAERIRRLRSIFRVRHKSPEIQTRYRQLRRHSWRTRFDNGLRSGGRAVRGAGVGIGVQVGLSEGLKATTNLDDDTANMVVMPVSEAAGMVAFDGVVASGAGAGVASTMLTGGACTVAVVLEATRRSAENHTTKLSFDNNTLAIGGTLTAHLMRRNYELMEAGEIKRDEMVRRNNALAASARQEGDEIAQDAQWISARCTNLGTAVIGTIGDGIYAWFVDQESGLN